MRGFENLAVHFGKMEALLPFFTEMNEHFYLAAIIGCIITAIIQSSTAMTGIAMGFIHSGIINLPAAIAIMFGANIGTCVDGYRGKERLGKGSSFCPYLGQCNRCYGLFPFISLFQHVQHPFLTNPEIQIAHASVLFNVATSIFCFLLAPLCPFYFVSS